MRQSLVAEELLARLNGSPTEQAGARGRSALASTASSKTTAASTMDFGAWDIRAAMLIPLAEAPRVHHGRGSLVPPSRSSTTRFTCLLLGRGRLPLYAGCGRKERTGGEEHARPQPRKFHRKKNGHNGLRSPGTSPPRLVSPADVLAAEGGLHLLSPLGWEDASAGSRARSARFVTHRRRSSNSAAAHQDVEWW